MNVSIAVREPHHLDELVKLFHATHTHNGYPVEGPPDRESLESRLEFFAGDDPSLEILGLVACQGRADYDAQQPNGSSGNCEELGGHENERQAGDDEGRVLGHVSLRRVSRGSVALLIWRDVTGNTKANDGLCEVCRLAVDPVAQGKGVGGTLLGAIEARARSERKPLILGVLEKDVAAIRMYDKRGWTRFGQDKMVGRDGRVWVEHFYICPTEQRHDQ